MDKIAVTADLHLKLYADNMLDDVGLPLKLREIFDTFENICEHCRKHSIKDIALLGDINETKYIVHGRVFSVFKDILLKNSDLTFHIIGGNHDTTLHGSYDETAVYLLEGPPNVNIYLKPTRIHNIDFFPYTHNLPNILKESDGGKILFSHFDVYGSELSTGIKHKETTYTPEMLEKWELVILGDIHKPQVIRDFIYYTGSPVQKDRGEANEEKRFLIVDTNTLEVESVPTEGYRRYRKFKIESEEDLQNIIQEYGSIENIDDDNITIENYLPILPDELSDAKHVRVKDKYEAETFTRGITEDLTLEEKMKQWLTICNIPEKLHEKYIEVGLKYIKNKD